MCTHKDDSVEAILGAMREGVIIVDETPVVCFANQAASRLLATPVDELVKKPPGFPVPDSGSAEISLPAGIILELWLSPITWRARPAQLITLRDVTEQRKIESELRMSESRHRLLAQNVPGGNLYLFDRNLRFITAEGTAMGRYGFKRADFEGSSLQEGLGEELARLLEPVCARTIAGEEGDSEIAYGDAVFRITTMPIRDAEGQVSAGMALSQDITRLKRTEQESRGLSEQLQDRLYREERVRVETESQRALLQGALDHAPAMICVHQGPEHVYLYANENYCKPIGRNETEILGKPVREALPEVAGTGLFEILDDVYRRGEAFHASEMLVPIDVDHDGALQDMYFTFSYQPMRDAGGNVTGILAHAIDVTAHVLARRDLEQMNQEIAALNRKLEQRVAERTAANEELEAFAYSVSHDLRAPLRRIDGFSRALLEDFRDKLDDSGWHYLSRIRASTQHMGEIIDDLLALSQVSRQALRVDEVSLSDLAHSIVEGLREQAPERQVDVHIAPAMTARGDARLLRLALENLLGNAWKFTSKREQAVIEIGVEIQGGEPEDGHGQPVFFVRDNGAGFDPTFKAKLFGTFNRLHSPADFPGTGIGLASVKRVLDRHGGRIWADGAVEQGAVFYFMLP